MHIRKMVNNELKNKKWYYFPSRRLAVALSLQGWRKAGATVFFTAGFTLLAHVPDPGESAFSYAECPLPGIRPIRPRIRMIRKRVSNSFGPKCGFRPPLPNHVADSSAHHLPAYSPTAVRSGNANASDRRFGISNPTRNHPQKSDRLPLALGPQEERKGILLIGIERRDMLLEVEDPFAQRSCRMQLPHRKFRKRFYVINNLHIV